MKGDHFLRFEIYVWLWQENLGTEGYVDIATDTRCREIIVKLNSKPILKYY